MTRKIYHYIFKEMRWNSIFLGMSQDGNLAIDLTYNLQELIMADTPEAQSAALYHLNVTAGQLANLATECEIDLSDPERLEIFATVRKKCKSRLLLDVPGMSTSEISRFVDDHVNFVAEFDELNTRELIHRQRALARA
jgi:hypothetical protein